MAAKSGANRIEKALQDIEVIQAFIADTNFYRRKYERRKTNFKTSMKVFTSDGKEFDAGTAACQNITPEGVLLSKLKLKKNCVPLDGPRCSDEDDDANGAWIGERHQRGEHGDGIEVGWPALLPVCQP